MELQLLKVLKCPDCDSSTDFRLYIDDYNKFVVVKCDFCENIFHVPNSVKLMDDKDNKVLTNKG